jgi:hypothetical protein
MNLSRPSKFKTISNTSLQAIDKEQATASCTGESKSSSLEVNPSDNGKAAPSTESGQPKDVRRGSAASRVAQGKDVCFPNLKGDDLNFANFDPYSAGGQQDTGRTKFKRSVSFADEISTLDSVSPRSTAAHSRSLSSTFAGPTLERPVNLIPERLRGPSFSQEFEHNMKTLPMPPMDHVTPGGTRRSTNLRERTISVLSERPKGFWSEVRSKLTKPFKGCFGAE